MSALLAFAMMVPPPVAGDDRTAILATVRSLVDALASRDHEAADALLEREGSMVSVDLRNDGAPIQTVMPFSDLRAPVAGEQPVMTESLGVPTVLQRGAIAQVWVPYRFSTAGATSHCGMNAFTLVWRDDRWRTASLVYTIEDESECASLAAPGADD